MSAVVCRYTREGSRIVGTCPELGLRTAPMLNRGDVEAELHREVMARLRVHADDVCFRDEATEDPP